MGLAEVNILSLVQLFFCQKPGFGKFITLAKSAMPELSGLCP